MAKKSHKKANNPLAPDKPASLSSVVNPDDKPVQNRQQVALREPVVAGIGRRPLP
jgi:hypothetical protein